MFLRASEPRPQGVARVRALLGGRERRSDRRARGRGLFAILRPAMAELPANTPSRACFLGRHLRRTPDSTRRASPACDPTWAALVAKGRTGTATTYSKGGDVPRMRLDVERAAELSTSEPDKGSIKIVAWKPVEIADRVSRGDVEAYTAV